MKNARSFQDLTPHSYPSFYKFAILRLEDSTLLGAPLSRGSALGSCLEDKISNLRSTISRLRLLPAQEPLIILRSSFNTPSTYARPVLLALLWSSPPSGAWYGTKGGLPLSIFICQTYIGCMPASLWRAVGLKFDVLCHWHYLPSWRLLWPRPIFGPPFCLEEYKMSKCRQGGWIGSFSLVLTHYHLNTCGSTSNLSKSLRCPDGGA